MIIEDDPFGTQSIAVSSVVSSALFAALIQKLAGKGLLSDLDVHDLYDDALHALERDQAEAAPDVAEMYAQAREVIEGPLKELGRPPGRDSH